MPHLTIERGRTEEITVHVPVDQPWYIMHRVATISHIGTDIEAPYRRIENIANLAALSRSRVFVCALPIPVRGLDPFPLRLVAFE